ncbi:hypothetical protein EJB05_53909 [Eragrostis curvula]|uniref:Uncharacterized protein n=1 Tax=Eragrostis curvula TaxID=38414 RepID=A0A5J9SNV9_9POAL|nr:hypothetical protein EJB05_53909 [Eragrostis curvula]
MHACCWRMRDLPPDELLGTASPTSSTRPRTDLRSCFVGQPIRAGGTSSEASLEAEEAPSTALLVASRLPSFVRGAAAAAGSGCLLAGSIFLFFSLDF